MLASQRGGMKLCPNTGERSERGFGYLWLSKLLWQFGQQKIASTASHEGSDKRTEMTCGLRWKLSKNKSEKTLLLGLVSVDAAIGWVSLEHEQRPSI